VLVLVAAAESSSQPSWAWIIGIAGIAVGVALAIWTWRRELANRRREHERQLERDRQEREGRYIWRFVRRWQVDRNPPALWLHVTIESTGTRPVQIRDIALRSELGQPGVVLEAWKDNPKRTKKVHTPFEVPDGHKADLWFDAADVAAFGATLLVVTGSGVEGDVQRWEPLPPWDADRVRQLVLMLRHNA
jgi:hypothetical protein